MRILLIAFLLLLAAMQAQVAPPLLARASSPADFFADTTPAREFNAGSRFLARAALGTLGWEGGAAVGGVFGYHALGYCTGCEDPGLTQMVIGAAVGGVMGTALLAAVPGLKDRCSNSGRFKGALLGGGLAAAGGILILHETGMPLAVPVLTISGGGAGTFLCARGAA